MDVNCDIVDDIISPMLPSGINAGG